MLQIHSSTRLPLLRLVDPLYDEWVILWNETAVENGYSYMAEKRAGKPTLDEIKSIVKSWIDEQTDQRILSSHTYEGHMVWLSAENQLNYKAAYDLAVQFKGEHGTLPLVFKLGTTDEPVYREFKTLEELTGFYLGVVAHKTACLTAGWQRKDNVNWERYEQD